GSRDVMAVAIICPKCGQALQVGENDSRPEIECLWCGASCPVPARAKQVPKVAPVVPMNLEITPKAKPAPPPDEEERPPAGKWYEQAPYAFKDNLPAPTPVAPQSPEPPPFVAKRPTVSFSDDDDGQPYAVDGRDKACPGCGRFMPVEAVVCT